MSCILCSYYLEFQRFQNTVSRTVLYYLINHQIIQISNFVCHSLSLQNFFKDYSHNVVCHSYLFANRSYKNRAAESPSSGLASYNFAKAYSRLSMAYYRSTDPVSNKCVLLSYNVKSNAHILVNVFISNSMVDIVKITLSKIRHFQVFFLKSA